MTEDLNNSLKHLDVFGALQSIHMRKLTGTVESISGTRRISIVFERGEVVRSCSRSFGDEAVLDYLSIAGSETGSCFFTEVPLPIPESSSRVNESLVNLLLKRATDRIPEEPFDEHAPGRNNECSFCLKRREQVAMLIAGPAGGTICDECVEVCTEVLSENLFSTTDLKSAQSIDKTTEASDGENVRSTLLDLIVNQALHGVDWRVVCAGPMLTNQIAAEEVEAELAARLSSPGFTFADIFGKQATSGDVGSMFDLLLGQLNQMRARIEKLEADRPE